MLGLTCPRVTNIRAAISIKSVWRRSCNAGPTRLHLAQDRVPSWRMLRVLLTLALGEALRAPGALRARPARRAAAPVSMMAGGAKKILVLGGDGFCGWPTAVHLSDKGHAVTIVDNLSRRDIDWKLATPKVVSKRCWLIKDEASILNQFPTCPQVFCFANELEVIHVHRKKQL